MRLISSAFNPRVCLTACLAACLLAILTGPCAAQSRFYFASQYNWEGKQGFYLDVEGSKMATLPLLFGIGDGKGWRFIGKTPPFVGGHTYTARAILTPKLATLELDGKLIDSSEGAFLPSATPFTINDTPGWASGLGDYLMTLVSVSAVVERGGKEVGKLDQQLETGPARSAALQLFERGNPQDLALDVKPGDSLTVTVVFRCDAVDLKGLAPFIDKYGQCRYADWPEKVHTDQDLRDDLAREEGQLAAMPPSPDVDKYGGFRKAGWTMKPTGYFFTVKRDGMWWLISPEGNPCFFTGCCAAPACVWETTPVSDREYLFEWLPPHDGPMAACWKRSVWSEGGTTDYACFYAANCMRKYGDQNWVDRLTALSRRRLASWGFSGGGKWGAPQGLVDTPVLGLGATPRVTDHPDVFDAKVCGIFAAELEKQITPRLKDPFVLGWSFGNEWGEQVHPNEIADLMKKTAEVPAKRALIDFAVDKLYDGSIQKAADAWKVTAPGRDALYATTPTLPPADVEAMRRFFEDKYWSFIYATIKRLDPNHLYLGSWIVPTWWDNEEDWRIVGKYCDVIGFDRYNDSWDDPLVSRLEKETDKPVYCGEFSFPAFYGGTRGFGRYGAVAAKDDKDAGDLYYKWVNAAARDPYCVGMSWFFFRDQPLTGRGPGRGTDLDYGEHYAFGLITEQDKPKWAMVTRMRDANLQAARWRLAHRP